MSPMVYLIFVVVIAFGLYKGLRKDEKEDKSSGTLFIYQNELGSFEIYTELNRPLEELIQFDTATFKVEVLDKNSR